MPGGYKPTIRVVLADPMPGVRAGLHWLLRAHDGVAVSGEAADGAAALRMRGDVVLAGWCLGDLEVLLADSRPVVVFSWLPPDERDSHRAAGAFAVLEPGRLREDLPGALAAAVGRATRAGA